MGFGKNVSVWPNSHPALGDMGPAESRPSFMNRDLGSFQRGTLAFPALPDEEVHGIYLDVIPFYPHA